ncbi:7264_t:CDS:2, partial [Gigaspora margarita]
SNPTFKNNLIESIHEIFEKQYLKDNPFETYNAASDEEIEIFWKAIHQIDEIQRLKDFYDHCCTTCHYSFTIKKYEKDNCVICKPPRCLLEIFNQLHCLPDPIPGNDLHYKSFEELYGTVTTEKYRPLYQEKILQSNSSKIKQRNKSKHTIPFCPSALRAKNIGVTAICTKCNKPWLLFSAKKISDNDYRILCKFLDTILYTCGTTFKNTNKLTSTALLLAEFSNNCYDNISSPEIIESSIENDNDESNNYKNSINLDDIVVSDYENSIDLVSEEKEKDQSDQEEKDQIVISDPVQELFTHIFVNDSWTCASLIEKPYYLAKIYPSICYTCGSPDIERMASKNTYSTCNNCTTSSKKQYKWELADKNNRKKSCN